MISTPAAIGCASPSTNAAHHHHNTAAATAKMTVPAASIIPQGVGAPPPPGLDPKKGKLMCIKVRMLDDTVGVFHLGHKAVGQALFDEVCRHLNLLECDYFGLEFLDCFGNRCWLDKDKSILKQITLARSDARFYFMVKFYTPTPADLEEEYTRYLFALQIKRDLAGGQFVCNENTASLMASYIVQSECGDFSSDDYHDHSYLSTVRFVPNQSAEFEKKVMDNHKKLIGMTPAESDLALLETARRSEFYGVKFHGARDVEGTPVTLAVLHSGIKVYHQLTCASTFSWAKVRKLSFKRKKLQIKLLPESFMYYKDTIEFSFDTRNECKMFWKKTLEHHAFFRCTESIPVSRAQSKFFSKGSSFRYSGRTQKQLIDYVREHHKRREPFTRPLHSSKTKKINDERLIPTPSNSQPGTLTRENGNLASKNMNQSYQQQQPHYDPYQQPSATIIDDSSHHHHAIDPRSELHYDNNDQTIDQYHNDPIDYGPPHQHHTAAAAHYRPMEDSSYGVDQSSKWTTNPAQPTIIPPTPDTPLLRRRGVQGAVGGSSGGGGVGGGNGGAIRQQITFHFPVTEISPDSPSSSSCSYRGGPPGGAAVEEEWAAPPTPSTPPVYIGPGGPLSPGVVEALEEDNISEDSYHLAENELIAQRIHQRRYPNNNEDGGGPRQYISTSLPMSMVRRRAAEGRSAGDPGCTCEAPLTHRPIASASLEMVYPSNTPGTSSSVQSRPFPEVVRGLPGPLPGRVLPPGPILVARTKPIPPPKPKMGLTHLEKSARGDYMSGGGGPGTRAEPQSPSAEPMVISRSTVTTTEITVKKIMYDPSGSTVGTPVEPARTSGLVGTPQEHRTAGAGAVTGRPQEPRTSAGPSTQSGVQEPRIPVEGASASPQDQWMPEDKRETFKTEVKLRVKSPTARTIEEPSEPPTAPPKPGKPQAEITTSAAAKRVAFVVTPESSIEGSPAPLNPVFPSDSESTPVPPALPHVPPAPPPVVPFQSVPVIEVQSEECPDIRHKIVNGDIPYILHVRHVHRPTAAPADQAPTPIGASSSTFSTFRPPSSSTPYTAVTPATPPGATPLDAREVTPPSPTTGPGAQRRPAGRRKSFDLVPRKRLPSPASFSSQDHSVSPDSDNDIAGYVNKFRSNHPTSSKGSSTSKRRDPRRMTQPIGPPKPVAPPAAPKPAHSQPCIAIAGPNQDDDDEDDVLVTVESMDDPFGPAVVPAAGLRHPHVRFAPDVSSVPAAPTASIEPPYIDDRASSESLTSADYDNLPPVRRSAANATRHAAASTNGGGERPTNGH